MLLLKAVDVIGAIAALAILVLLGPGALTAQVILGWVSVWLLISTVLDTRFVTGVLALEDPQERIARYSAFKRAMSGFPQRPLIVGTTWGAVGIAIMQVGSGGPLVAVGIMFAGLILSMIISAAAILGSMDTDTRTRFTRLQDECRSVER